MSERVNGFVVVLRDEVSSEYAERVEAAIRLIGEVCDVKPIEADIRTSIARSQAHYEISNALWETLDAMREKRKAER